MKRLSALLLAVIVWTPLVAAQLPEVGSEGGPLRALDKTEEQAWLAGREIFEREWKAEEGLGSPNFNAVSCAACHKDPATGGAGNNEFNVIQGGGVGFSHYGESSRGERPQFRRGKAPTPVDRLTALRNQRKESADRGRTEEQLKAQFPEIQTPSLLGLGLIDTISDEEILRREDPEDRDRDGIRGVARRHTVEDATEVGRFGWKAQTPRLDDFVCMALQGEVGLTAPDQGRGFGSDFDLDDVDDPEVDTEAFDQLTFFIRQLAPPVPSAEWKDYQGQVGERFFDSLGCVKCHVTELQGADGPVRLYSDLLLHDVVPESKGKARRRSLHEARVERQEKTKEKTQELEPLEVRTPPLWGIAKTAPYWHDGSAADLHAAILAHGGEAARVREDYSTLEEIDQQALLVFLKRL